MDKTFLTMDNYVNVLIVRKKLENYYADFQESIPY